MVPSSLVPCRSLLVDVLAAPSSRLHLIPDHIPRITFHEFHRRFSPSLAVLVAGFPRVTMQLIGPTAGPDHCRRASTYQGWLDHHDRPSVVYKGDCALRCLDVPCRCPLDGTPALGERTRESESPKKFQFTCSTTFLPVMLANRQQLLS